ncbi:PREDICTED: pre-rRNA processing protein FTSJ3-like [Amphimedon queenslandica]|uniref:Ribosomal RNA methyltransferase SPB1-like C-terminal domain-containing protein n=1 Tax=Amphimedon queenslandica TaxID=400682 RepID=A0A1X7UGG3_AMPQE|nr:PREDICTED: pre-rRNA processing protein FTSJ3-like [Amphimedon queenslandica]|eukprot:XP_011405096.1 PREDICTED: pre-rRNA processing protein FTSJ3-like [Amphimedon queenslandica]
MKEFLDQVSDSEDESGTKGADSDNEMDFILRYKRKQRRKVEERLKSQQEKDNPVTGEVTSGGKEKLFSLNHIKTSNQLEEVEGEDIDGDALETDDEEASAQRPLLVEEDYNIREDSSNEEEENEEGEIEYEESDDDDNDEDMELDNEDKSNPLVVSLKDKKKGKSQKTVRWFSNPLFEGVLSGEKDEEEEVAAAMERYKQKGGKIINKEEEQVSNDEDENESVKQLNTCLFQILHIEVEDIVQDPAVSSTAVQHSGFDDDSDTSEDEEDVAPKKVRKLDPAGLAIGALLVQSHKKRQDLIESGYNRWTSDDPNLPDWFREDESSHCQKQLPITKDMVDKYRKKLKEINARPIKKIAEAKARKKQRAARKLTKAREKARVICDTPDVTDQKKVRQIKGIYKKAGLASSKKRDVQYVVAKRGLGKRVKRPAGVSGRFKVVDPRMKKDNRRQKAQYKKQRKH